jgi:hypothetical protein
MGIHPLGVPLHLKEELLEDCHLQFVVVLACQEIKVKGFDCVVDTQQPSKDS